MGRFFVGWGIITAILLTLAVISTTQAQTNIRPSPPVKVTAAVNGTGQQTVAVPCPPGTFAEGGGFDSGTGSISISQPIGNPPTGWAVSGIGPTDKVPLSWSLTVFAVCDAQ